MVFPIAPPQPSAKALGVTMTNTFGDQHMTQDRVRELLRQSRRPDYFAT